jgi:hypothetical protein
MKNTACLKLAKKFNGELHKILKEPNIPHLKPAADLVDLDLCELNTEWNFLHRQPVITDSNDGLGISSRKVCQVSSIF